jgi:hypothetical protein
VVCTTSRSVYHPTLTTSMEHWDVALVQLRRQDGGKSERHRIRFFVLLTQVRGWPTMQVYRDLHGGGRGGPQTLQVQVKCVAEDALETGFCAKRTIFTFQYQVKITSLRGMSNDPRIGTVIWTVAFQPKNKIKWCFPKRINNWYFTVT